MPKLRKQRRKQKFQAGVNRKRRKNRQVKKGKGIKCEQIKNEWDYKKSTKQNLENMGLIYDPNSDLKECLTKNNLISKVASTTDWQVSNNKTTIPKKKYVVKKLEEEAKAPREKMFRLPNSHVELLSYYLDKYGNDYKAMVRDKKNIYQETWKQIRAKIRIFKSIPEQYSVYLESQGKSDDWIESLSEDSE